MALRRTNDPRFQDAPPYKPDLPTYRAPQSNREDVPAFDYDRYAGLFQSFLDQSRGGGNTSPGFATRSVQGNETVRGQLDGLLRSDSEYIRRARMEGQRTAAARGSQAGSYYAGAAEGAAIDRGLPIASQDAGWYGQTAADNMDAENRSRIVGSQNATTLANTRMGISGDLAGQGIRAGLEREQNALSRNFQRDESGLDRDHDSTMRREDRTFQAGQNQANRDFTADQADRDRTFSREEGERDYIRSITSGVMLAILSRPEYFRDPAGASGALRFFTQEIDSILNDIFSGRDPTQPPTGPSPGSPGG